MSSTTTQPDQRYQALVAAQGNTQALSTAQAVAIAAAAAASFTGWYDSAQIADWAMSLATRIEGLQRAIARSTDAYLARALSELTGRRVRPVGAVDVTGLRVGITHAGAYGRAADVYRWQQSQFDAIARSLLTDTPRSPDIADPVQAAAQRVSQVANSDAQLAFRAQSQQVISGAGQDGVVTGYRRVIHPELSRGHTCGLCVAASDRLYGPTEPLPMHADCHCTTLPVVDGADPGSTLNQADLGRLYEDAGGPGREQLKRTRYQVDEHGELGPVLNPAGTKVRTARDANRDRNRVRPAKTDAEKAAEVARIRTSLAATVPKAQDLARSDPKAWGHFLTRLEDRIRDLDQQLAA